MTHSLRHQAKTTFDSGSGDLVFHFPRLFPVSDDVL